MNFILYKLYNSLLPSDEWNERHKTRAFNGLRNHFLLLQVCPAVILWLNLPKIRRKTAQERDVFVINVLNRSSEW